MAGHEWSPITDLPSNWENLCSKELPALVVVWQEQAERLKKSKAFSEYLVRLRRQIAIETGIIERLYSIDRGITQLLIEKGIDEVYIPHGSTDKPAAEVISMIRDHDLAIDGLYAYIASNMPLTRGYLQELHKVLTAHQHEVEAVTMEGMPIAVSLLRGEWKKWPNNPSRRDSSWLHEYCPPEHVEIEVEHLIAWHRNHESVGVCPEVSSAWLHHRFTQIHPFQDGNGRMARCLATLVFLKAGWFPLVVTRDDRDTYISALEAADAGDLKPLVDLFAARQKRAFVQSLSLSEDVLAKGAQVKQVLESARDVVKERMSERSRDYSQVNKIAEELQAALLQRLQAIANEITQIVRDIGSDYRSWITHSSFETPHDFYHRYQIVQNARSFDYYANTDVYRSWAAIHVQTNARTELLFSFHGVGKRPMGVLVCAALAYKKEPTETSETRIDDIQPMNQDLFEFTYLDTVDSTKARFSTWVEESLVSGLEYWRQSI